MSPSLGLCRQCREAAVGITRSNMDRPMIRDWRVSDECSLFGHQLISFNINLSSGFHKHFRNLKRSEWRRLQRVNLGIIPLIASMIKLDILLSFNRDACPLTYPGKRSQPVSWNTELQRLHCCTSARMKI